MKNDKNFAYNIYKSNKSIFSNSTVFTTRNICHLGHQLIHEKIIKLKKKLLICIIQSEKNKFNSDFLIKSYEQLKLKEKLYKNIQIDKLRDLTCKEIFPDVVFDRVLGLGLQP
mgnify:CR=1 FL=1